VTAAPPAPLDLRPFACPLTYVKARIALDRLAPGEVVELWLSAGEPVESVPRSAEEDGHRVVSVEPLEGAERAFRVLVQKGAPREAGGLP
jgi:tRNA 2-thiouridine synthesizing protein A